MPGVRRVTVDGLCMHMRCYRSEPPLPFKISLGVPITTSSTCGGHEQLQTALHLQAPRQQMQIKWAEATLRTCSSRRCTCTSSCTLKVAASAAAAAAAAAFAAELLSPGELRLGAARLGEN